MGYPYRKRHEDGEYDSGETKTGKRRTRSDRKNHPGTSSSSPARTTGSSRPATATSKPSK